jgi:Ca-activated chloride channel family protein
MSEGFDVTLSAARPALVAGHENSVEVLIRVQAPDAPKSGLPERRPLNLAFVIDRSGSMAGEPLHQAKRCAAFMIDSLTATDRACVVAYDDSVEVFVYSRPVTNKEHFKSAIAHLRDGGSTNLHGGWLKGAEEAAGHLDPATISRVLLLSDGNANAGLTSTDQIATQCAQLADNGVTTSTYGLGSSFNEELMMAMARSGRGNGYYSETADSLLERFREEFSLLSSLCARRVQLRLSPLPGVHCELLNFYESAGEGSWRLPDLVYDGEAWAAVRLRVAPAILPAVGETLELLQASVVYQDLKGVETKIPASWLSLTVMVDNEFQALAVDEPVIRRFREAEAARLQEFASRAARLRDWNEVDRLVAQARKLASANPWLGDIVTNLEQMAGRRDQELFSKEAAYASSSMSSRLRSKTEFAAGVQFDDSDAPAHLRRKTRQGASEPSRPPKGDEDKSK